MTNDGGLNWRNDTLAVPAISPYADCKVFGCSPQLVVAADAQHAFLLLRVEDSLIVQKGKSFYVGMKIHHAIFATTDGGGTWSELTNVPALATVSDLYFRNALVGYMTSDSGRIFRTSDGGASWTATQAA